MKKILLLLVLHIAFVNAFSQSLNFQENFEKGVFTNAWKITNGKWYVANLADKGITPPDGGNNYALASGGNGEITLDLKAHHDDLEIPLQLSFTYWVHSDGSTGQVSLVFLNDRGETISTIQFDALQQKNNWELFSQEYKAPTGTAVIRLKLGEISAAGKNTVYFKSFCGPCRRRGA
ncbi:MAG TPA: hypothetical protein VLJ68_02110 [Chitinophagaceae bacterium]|nr:hypothetical protein [Chitinophagaceae bacterium]